jgi:hypothetical protein
MRRAILIYVLAAAPLLVAFFRWGGSLSSSDVDSFFRGHTGDTAEFRKAADMTDDELAAIASGAKLTVIK